MGQSIAYYIAILCRPYIISALIDWMPLLGTITKLGMNMMMGCMTVIVLLIWTTTIAIATINKKRRTINTIMSLPNWLKSCTNNGARQAYAAN